MPRQNENSMDTWVNDILQLKKYRQLAIPAQTVQDLIERGLANHLSPRQAVDEARKKLHNIVAPYLGDPDYPAAERAFHSAFANQETAAIRAICLSILEAHASTRERLPILDTFYHEIFRLTGRPASILDIACGLNPFAFPWMELPTSTRYYAYDLNQPRIDLINTYFRLQGMAPLAVKQDILLDPPQVNADMAFFFKEAHRFEQRLRGCNLGMWRALKVHWLLVSLPTQSLSGKHDLLDKHRHLVYETIKDENWKVEELIFEDEIVFCIQKPSTGEIQ